MKSLKSLKLIDCHLDEIAIKELVSGSPLLEYLNLDNCTICPNIVIDSNSLRMLILRGLTCDGSVEISCPNLETLQISDQMDFESLRLINLPSSVHAILDFFYDMETCSEFEDIDDVDYINLVKETLLQLQHVEKLEVGHWIMEILLSYKEKEDDVSGLPDSFMHRILSFLPSTKKQKTDNYKPRQHHWTNVPFLSFVPNEKFFIDSKDIPLIHMDPRLALWICFAVKREVQELILDCDSSDVKFENQYPLPQFLFNNSSLVKMKLCSCDFNLNGRVNWESLRSLCLKQCEFDDQVIENVIYGSPLLEHLELIWCCFESGIVIASMHLKTFILEDLGCKRDLIEISCPNLESLRISGNMGSAYLKLTNLPSSLHAILNFYVLESKLGNVGGVGCINRVKETLRQLQHVAKLEIGHWIMEVLSSCEEEDNICGLPDSVILRILSFLPSTEKTDYYKTWHHQWTSVPILSFVPNEKFCIDSEDIPFRYLDPRLALWIRFAVKRDVKELILDCDSYFVVEIWKQ